MALDTEVLEIIITARDEAQAAFAETQAEMDTVGSHAGMMGHSIGIGMVAAGAIAAGVLALSTKAAVDFQSMTTKVMNNTTMGAAGMATMRAAILQMSAASGAPLDQLANGFMHIQNLGYSTADSITILQQAMESAVSTGSNTGDVANALALQMHDFGLNATQAARAMDVMHLAAAEGNATLEQYVDSTSKAVSTAANLGLSMTDTDAALSALSRHMNISQASTMLAGMLQKISGPSVGAQKELAALSKTSGIDLVADFSAAGLKARGLTGVLADLEAATHGNYTEIQKLIPATRGGMAALVLNGTASKDYQTILASLNATMAGQSTPTIQAYAAYLSTAAGTQARLSAGLNVMAIEIGTAVLPALQNLLSATLPVVQSLTTWVGKHAQLTAHILEGVAAVGLLTAAIMVLTPVVSAVGAVLGAVSLPLVAVAAGGALLYEAWTHDFGGIQEKTQGVWTTIKPVFDAMGNALTTLRAAFTAGGLGAVFADLPGALGGVGNAASGVGAAIAAQFGSINWPQVEAAVVHGLNDVFNTMGSWLQQTGIPFFTGHLRDIGVAFSHIDWGAIGSAILAGLGRLVQDVRSIDWGGLGRGILDALAALRRDIEAVNWGGIWNALKHAFTATVHWIASLNWSGWAQDAITGIRTALNTVSAWLRGTGVPFWQTAVIPWIGALWTWVGKVTAPLLTALGGLLGQMGTWISDQAHRVGTAMLGWANALVSWIPGATVRFLKAWPGMLSSFMDWIGNAAGPILGKLAVWGAQFVAWILPMIPGMLKEAVKIQLAMLAFVAETAGTILVGLAKWGIAFIKWILPSIPGMVKELFKIQLAVILWIPQQIKEFTQALIGWGEAFGPWVMRYGWPALYKALGQFNLAFIKWTNNASTTIKNDFTSMGAQIIQGLIDGITHNAGKLPGEMRSLAKNYVESPFKDFLSIFSPSLVFHAHGQNIVQGLINGIASKSGALHAQMLLVAKQIADTSLQANGSLPSAALLGGAGGGSGGQTNNITVHIHGTSAAVNGDQNGLGKYVGDVLIQAFRTLDRSASASNTVAGRLSLGGAI